MQKPLAPVSVVRIYYLRDITCLIPPAHQPYVLLVEYTLAIEHALGCLASGLVTRTVPKTDESLF